MLIRNSPVKSIILKTPVIRLVSEIATTSVKFALYMYIVYTISLTSVIIIATAETAQAIPKKHPLVPTLASIIAYQAPLFKKLSERPCRTAECGQIEDGYSERNKHYVNRARRVCIG